MDLESSDDVLRIVAPRIASAEELRRIPVLTLAGWDGKPARLYTEAILAHDTERLLVEFRGRHETIEGDESLPKDRPTPRLWERDVVEVLISDWSEGAPYREIEASPFGQWLALAFDARRVPAAKPWRCVPQVRVARTASEFTVRISIPLEKLRTSTHNRRDGWRVGLFRIHGREPAREYLAIYPLNTAAPDFHQPSRWAHLTLGA